jgi:hypothetical protein
MIIWRAKRNQLSSAESALSDHSLGSIALAVVADSVLSNHADLCMT